MATAANMGNPNQIKDEVNILLLSETGVGKSTFVNSFFNYLYYNTLEDACRSSDLQCIIPTKFTVTDDEFNEREVKFGSDVNESMKAGESATLKTKSYVFEVPRYDKKLRIIDTPGIGDTRGIEQDDRNQKNIVHYLSGITCIHAVCILLKPHQPRCTVSFQHCINQLLVYLHKSVIPNIVFVFTSTASSFFTPGETVHSLQKVLKDIEEKQKVVIPFTKDNTFCIDNESFRYLIAKKNGLKLGSEKIFSTSFLHSRNECWRIINYAMSSPNYLSDNTVYLYKVREKFEDLCHALTDTTKLLKSDSACLKKLHSLLDSEVPTEIMDAKNHIEEIEGRMCKFEHEKNNLILQISKIILYLRTDSIILLNDFVQSYVSYLIDVEMSKGIESHKGRIRNYHNMIDYFESIRKIIEMDIHVDPFSPFITRDELSVMFPQLEKEFELNMDDTIIKNELEILHDIDYEELEEESDTEKDSNSDAFTFEKWFHIIKDSVSNLSDNLEKGVDYEVLRKQYVQQEDTAGNTKHRNNTSNNKFTKPNTNYHKVPFKKHPNYINKTNNRDPHFSNEATCSRTPHQRFPNRKVNISSSKSNLEGKCFLDQMEDSSERTDDFVFVAGNSNFVSDDAQRYNSHSGFRGRGRGTCRGRGRGRGGGRTNKQCNKTGELNASSSKQYNKQTSQNKGKSNSNKSTTPRSNKNADIPKNMLQSMKNIFD